MLVMSLDEDRAASLLEHMSDECVKKLQDAAESLAETQVGRRDKLATLVGFIKRQQGGFYIGDSETRFRKVLEKVHGGAFLKNGQQEAAKTSKKNRAMAGDEEESQPAEEDSLPPELASLMERSGEGKMGSEEKIAAALAEESVAISAVFLSALGGDMASKVLSLLEEEFREKVIGRMVLLEGVSQTVTEEVIRGMAEKMRKEQFGEGVSSAGKRPEEVADLLGSLDRSAQERILAQIRDNNPEFADEIQKSVFAFEELGRVEQRSLQKLLGRVNPSTLAIAVKGVDGSLESHIMENLSKRVRETVDEERELAGRVPVAEAEEAREEIMAIAREMEEAGELMLASEGEEDEDQYVE
jgi:flagellar motor switch protein FliG